MEPLSTPEIIASAKAAHEEMPLKTLWRRAKRLLREYDHVELLAEFIAFGHVSARRGVLLRRFIDLLEEEIYGGSKPSSMDEIHAISKEAERIDDIVSAAELWAAVYEARYPVA
jgi:hypothetical protein